MFLLLIVSLLAQAGEVGVHVETPEPTAFTWVHTTWTWGDLELSLRGEGGLLPAGFRRASAKLSWESSHVSLRPEAVVFGTGRIDTFLSGSAKWSTVFQDIVLALQVGGKAGWAAVNWAPTPILTSWAILRLEQGGLSGELSVDGPSPWVLGVRVGLGPLTLNLGTTVSLSLTAEEGVWSTSSLLQLWPTSHLIHSLRGTLQGHTFQASLNSSGQAWVRVSTERASWVTSAFLRFNFARLAQMVLEIQRTF